jgi:hypothetical protein
LESDAVFLSFGVQRNKEERDWDLLQFFPCSCQSLPIKHFIFIIFCSNFFSLSYPIFFLSHIIITAPNWASGFPVVGYGFLQSSLLSEEIRLIPAIFYKSIYPKQHPVLLYMNYKLILIVILKICQIKLNQLISNFFLYLFTTKIIFLDGIFFVNF